MERAKRWVTRKKESVSTGLKKTSRTMDNAESAGREAWDLIHERPAVPAELRDETLGGSRRGTRRSLKTRANNIPDGDGPKQLGGKIRSARRKAAGHYGEAGGRILPAGASTLLPHKSVLNKGDVLMSNIDALNAIARVGVYEGQRYRRHGHDYSKDEDLTTLRGNRLLATARQRFDKGFKGQGQREATSWFIGDVAGVADVEDAGKELLGEAVRAKAHVASETFRAKLDAMTNSTSNMTISEGPHYTSQPSSSSRYLPSVVETVTSSPSYSSHSVSYGSPSYSAPSYSTPLYSTPAYSAPRYSTPAVYYVPVENVSYY